MKRLAPLLLLFAACGEDHAKVPAPPPPGTALVLSAHVVSNLSDAAIVGVMVSFFEGEIEQAKIAHDRAQDPRVGAFADEVRIDDAAALDRMQNLARNLDLDPTKTSALRQHIDIENENALLRLTAASGDDFDTLYVDLLAKQGIEVIKIIDDQLMPAAKDPALRAELEMARALIAHHVMQAKDLLR